MNHTLIMDRSTMKQKQRIEITILKTKTGFEIHVGSCLFEKYSKRGLVKARYYAMKLEEVLECQGIIVKVWEMF